MIGKDELKSIAEMKRLSIQSAEKDYLLELLLSCIYGEFGNMLVLKGGTCLYKVYNLNRFSEDLDFTLNKRRFNVDKFIRRILRLLSLIGADGKVMELEKHGNEINVRLQFHGPLYVGTKESLCSVSLNLSKREKLIREPRKVLLIPTYREIPSFDIWVMDENEIIAEKVRAIMTRNKPRDVYDLWFLLQRGLRPDISMINRKLKIYGIKFTSERFLKSTEEKRIFWNTDMRGLVIGNLANFDEIKKEIIAGLLQAHCSR